eukprot:COSAG01_NODE_161_length_23642_cov_713.337000_24_plen_193_part_00
MGLSIVQQPTARPEAPQLGWPGGCPTAPPMACPRHVAPPHRAVLAHVSRGAMLQRGSTLPRGRCELTPPRAPPLPRAVRLRHRPLMPGTCGRSQPRTSHRWRGRGNGVGGKPSVARRGAAPPPCTHRVQLKKIPALDPCGSRSTTARALVHLSSLWSGTAESAASRAIFCCRQRRTPPLLPRRPQAASRWSS